MNQKVTHDERRHESNDSNECEACMCVCCTQATLRLCNDNGHRPEFFLGVNTKEMSVIPQNCFSYLTQITVSLTESCSACSAAAAAAAAAARQRCCRRRRGVMMMLFTEGMHVQVQPRASWTWGASSTCHGSRHAFFPQSLSIDTPPRSMPKSQKLAETKARPVTRSASPKASPRLQSKPPPASPRLLALSGPVSPRLAARAAPTPPISPRLSARAAVAPSSSAPSKRRGASSHVPEQPLTKVAKSGSDAAAKENSSRESRKRDHSPKENQAASSGKDASRSSRRGSAVAAAPAAQHAPPLRVDVVRCLGWLPSAIVSLAVDSRNRFVAAVRDNGWLELWCCSGSHWAVTSTFIVGAPSGIRCVLFMPSLYGADAMDRLFTADLSGNIVEWDVLTQSPCAHTLSFGGSVWALAAVPACADTIAVACQDGGTRLFSVAQPQSIILNKIAVRHSSPCVAVAAATTGSLLATGYEDGSCRVIDVLGVAAPITFRTVPSGDQVKHPRVWAVAFCGQESSNVAVADANGSVHVFDLSSGTLQQSMHISKNGDMLCLISDGCGGLLAASVNAKVFHIVCAHGVSAGSPWRVASACRLHTHDVYSLALFSKSTLLSGGLDCQLAVYALERGARSLRAVRKVMPLPRHGSVSSSSSGRHNVLAQISGNGILDLFRGDIGMGSDAFFELRDAGGGLGFELAVRVEPPKVPRTALRPPHRDVIHGCCNAFSIPTGCCLATGCAVW